MSEHSQSQQSDEEVESVRSPSKHSSFAKPETSQSESDGEEYVKAINKLFQFGDDLGIDIDGLENVEPNAILHFQEEEPKEEVKETRYLESSSSSDSDSEWEIPVLYAQNGGTVRVIQFSSIFIPQSQKKKDHLRLFNQKTMLSYEKQNEQDRARKRQIKEDYKKLCAMVQHKANYLPCNPYLEDFYYLHNCNKNGMQSKRLQQQREMYMANTNPLLTKISSNAPYPKHKPAKPIALCETKVHTDDSESKMLIESCRVEELAPQIADPTQLKHDLSKQFPAPHYTLLQKQVFAHLMQQSDGVKLNPLEITNHMIQEVIINQRYQQLSDFQGNPVKRQKYWGELKDASSEFQLEKDKVVCQKYQQKHSNLFKINASQTMIENFREYESVKDRKSAMFAQPKSSVTAKSIMRCIRHKMGLISDQDFYDQEVVQQDLPKPKRVSKPLQENLDVHFNERRMEIQQEIISKKERKEQVNQMNSKQSTTTAYEPISMLEPITLKEKAQDVEMVEQIKEKSDQSATSSSNEDEEQKDWLESNRATGGRVLPSLGDELNHAKCIKDLSFYKLNWEDRDLERFHRPDLSHVIKPWQQIASYPIVTKTDDKEKRLNPQDYFKDRQKLSLQKGKFCIFEHIDQHPLFLNNFGMASRLKRYFYDDKMPSKKVFYQRQQNMATRHMGPHGEIQLKGKPTFVDPLKKELGLIHTQRLDLLGQINTGTYQGITVLENKMYNAPLFYHNSQRNDFFCSVVQGKSCTEQRIVIRELESVYNVGQIEPKLEVVNPQSRYFQNLDKQRAKAYIIRFLQENETVRFQDIVDFFPQFREQILKNSLKESEIEIDRNGECKFTERFDEERFKERMTPEMICQYESARHGQYRLMKLGITQILGADKITPSLGKFNREETDLTLRRIAKLIESEVLSTPWNLSSSFIKVKQEGSMMLLNGAGDPSFGHGGYSYIKMPLKISGDSVQGAKDNRMNLNPAIKNPKAVTRTDADLRKLQKKVIYDKLLNQGFTSEQLKDKTRWQMVGMLRQTAPNLEENKKFARGVRYTSNKQREKYNQNANEKFAQQMKNLSASNPSYMHFLSEEEPDFTVSDQNKKAGQGSNAADFTEEIRNFTQEATRKLSVETSYELVKNLQKIDEIPNYLNLLLLKLDKMPPTASQAGNSTTQITSDYLESLSLEQLDDLKQILAAKIQSGEINKKQNVICKMIRSLTSEDGEYQRVIFCAQERMIKKFDRARKKNQSIQGVPRSKKRVVGQRLTAELMQGHSGDVGTSIASKSQIQDNQSVMSDKAKPKVLVSIIKRKKPHKDIVSQPIVKINFTDNPEPQKTTISFKIQQDPEEYDDEIEVMLSERDDDYGQLKMEPAKKSKKVKKQPSVSRFKSHGFAKEDFDYQQPLQNNRSQRKRQQQCDQALNQIFGDIVQELLDQDHLQLFHNQVTKKDAANYRDLIKKPICLKDIKNKTKRNEYKLSSEVLEDLQLMKNNSLIFNGAMHPVTLKAQELEELANTLVNEKIGEILNLETLVKEGGSVVV